MINSKRRNFIRQSSLALGALALTISPKVPFASIAKGNNPEHSHAVKPKLCFSTLGCPDWSFQKIIDFAVQYKYDGIEIRAINRETDINKIAEFSAANVNITKQRLADRNIKLVDLGSSAAMHHTDAVTRAKQLGDAKQYIDLAEKLNCPYIRVFPNNLPKDESRPKVLDLIVSGLNELSDYAKDSNVKILMESHGDLVAKDELVYVMDKVNHNKVGLIWDIMNAWSVTKEDPAIVYPAISKYIHHVHVKDGIFKDGKIQYVLLGKGVAPIKQAVQLLQHGKYDGYYSFEWEKLWHPEIEEPEVAFPQYPGEIMKYFV